MSNYDQSSIMLDNDMITMWSTNDGRLMMGQPDPRKCQAYRRMLKLRAIGIEQHKAVALANAVSDKRVQWAIERHDEEKIERSLKDPIFTFYLGVIMGACWLVVIAGIVNAIWNAFH